MVGTDLDYVQRMIGLGLVSGPVLEVGTAYTVSSCRDLITSSGLTHYGTDLVAGEGVDFVANLERLDDLAVFQRVAPFGSLLIMNVLEHTFDPIRVLDNARTLLKGGGTLVVVTPAIWSLHDYPLDVWRILPDFYEEYARRRGLRLVEECFEYVGFGAVKKFRNPDSTYKFPPPTQSTAGYWYGRVVHKALNTFGRAMFQPSHVAVGAVFVVPESAS